MEKWIVWVALIAIGAVIVTGNLLVTSSWLWARWPPMRWAMLVALGGAGVFFLAKGLPWTAKHYRLSTTGAVASGKVVDQRIVYSTIRGDRHVDEGENGSIASKHYRDYYPIVEFVDAQGRTVRFEGAVPGTDKAVPATGATVTVFYDRANPATAILSGFRQAWLSPLTVSVAGLFFFLCGIAGFLGGQRAVAAVLSREVVSSQLEREAQVQYQYSGAIKGVIDRVQKLDVGGPGSYVYICKARRSPKAAVEEFSTDFFDFKLDSGLVGRPVDIYLDSEDPKRYYVMSGPLLQEMAGRQKK